MKQLPAPPEVLPLFPLTGCLLLPGSYLPLNIFEPRYCNMVEDAMQEDNYIGMIQPLVPRQDNGPPEEPPEEAAPEVYSIGCAGHIEQCEPQPGGRFVLVLKGVSRFRVRQELPPRHGYRRVKADYGEFARDHHELDHKLNPDPLLAAVRGYVEANEIPFDLDLLESLPAVALVNGLSVAMPFAPAERQALLEAPGPDKRLDLLLSLMRMGIDVKAAEQPFAPPTVH